MKASLAMGTLAKATPTCPIMPLTLATGSTLRKPSASQSSDSSPGKAVGDGTRKKTNANALTCEESIEVKGSLAKMRELVTRVQVKGGKKSEIGQMIDSSVMQCEKATEHGK